MTIIYFATSSDIKFQQYRTIFSEFGVELEQGTVIDNTLIEPQYDQDSPDGISSLILHPLRLASRFISKNEQVPYMIEDTMLIVDSLSKNFDQNIGLPGADTKNWWVNLGAEGLLGLLENERNRKAKFICQLGAYLGAGRYIFADASTTGRISHRCIISPIAERDFPTSNPYFFHQAFKPDGSVKSYGEMTGEEFKKFDYRRKCAKEFSQKLMGNEFDISPFKKQLNLFEY